MSRVLWKGLSRRDDERRGQRLLTVGMDLVYMALGKGGSVEGFCVCVCVSPLVLCGMVYWLCEH